MRYAVKIVDKIISIDIKFDQRNNNEKYLDLKTAFRTVNDIFYNYVEQNNRKNVREIFRDYLDHPNLPDKVDMSQIEIQGYIEYVREHYPLLQDIQDDTEFQILTIIFSEFKMDFWSKRIEHVYDHKFNTELSTSYTNDFLLKRIEVTN